MSWFGSSGPTQQQLQRMQLEAMRLKAILDKKLVAAENLKIIPENISEELTTAATVPIPANLPAQQYMQLAQKLQGVLARVTDAIAASGNTMQQQRLTQGQRNTVPGYPPQYPSPYRGGRKHRSKTSKKSRKVKKTRRHK